MVDTKIPWTNKHKQEINKSRYLIEHPINSLFVFFVCAIFVILASTFLYAWGLSLGELPNLWVNVSWGVLHPNPRSTLLPSPTLQPKCSMGRWYIYLPTSPNGLGWWFGYPWVATPFIRASKPLGPKPHQPKPTLAEWKSEGKKQKASSRYWSVVLKKTTSHNHTVSIWHDQTEQISWIRKKAMCVKWKLHGKNILEKNHGKTMGKKRIKYWQTGKLLLGWATCEQLGGQWGVTYIIQSGLQAKQLLGESRAFGKCCIMLHLQPHS